MDSKNLDKGSVTADCDGSIVSNSYATPVVNC